MYVDKTPTWIFSRWKSHSSLSFFSHVRCSNSIIIFEIFCWNNSSMSICLSYRGARNWTQCSRCWLEGKDYLLWYAGNAFPDIAQGNLGFLYCKNVLSVKNPKYFSAKNFAFIFAEFHEIPVSPACWGPYELAAQPPSNNQPSKLFTICESAEAALCPTIQAINVNVEQYWSQHQWWHKALLKADTVLLTTTLKYWYLSQVSGHLIAPLSSLYVIIFSARLLQQTALKALFTSRPATLLLVLQASHRTIEGY